MTTIVDGTTGVTFPAGGVGNPAGAVVGTTDTQTLTNKSIVASQLTGTQTIPKATLPTGSVLQVVNLSTIGYSTASTTTWKDIPNVSLSITPTSATSKILVMLKLVGVGHSVGTTYCNLRLLRNGSAISNFDNCGGWTSTSTENNITAGYDYVDSPATTSATTYSVQFNSGANIANAQVGNYVSTAADSKHSVILMEIAA